MRTILPSMPQIRHEAQRIPQASDFDLRNKMSRTKYDKWLKSLTRNQRRQLKKATHGSNNNY